MANPQTSSSFLVLGDQSLLIQCCNRLLAAGHGIAAVVSQDGRIGQWATEHGIPCLAHPRDVLDHPAGQHFDYLLSVTNLRMLPADLLARARRLAINFHDGPLPRYAGLNAPIWALMQGEDQHGITWHVMTAEADTGEVLVSRPIPIEPEDTGFTLNARCYEAGLAAFGELLDALDAGTLRPQPQDLSQRTYFSRAARPAAAATLDWRQTAEDLARLVRALDFGPYGNPLVMPKLLVDGTTLLVRSARAVEDASTDAPGTVQVMADGVVRVRCASGALEITQAADLRGATLDPAAYLQARGVTRGQLLPGLPAPAADIDAAVATLVRHEARWQARLRCFEATALPVPAGYGGGPVWRCVRVDSSHPAARWVTATAVTLGRLAQTTTASFAYVPGAVEQPPAWWPLYADGVLPLQVDTAPAGPVAAVHEQVERLLNEAESAGGTLRDLPARDPDLRARPGCDEAPVRVVRVRALDANAGRPPAAGAALTLYVPDAGDTVGIAIDPARIDRDAAESVITTFGAVMAQCAGDPTTTVGAIDLLTPVQRARLATLAHAEDEPTLPAAPALSVHEAFEQQVERTPDHVAAICRGERLTYRELNTAANRLARHLIAQGVVMGDRVGVMVERSLDMLVALYAVQKCGAAYVPLDPQYPAERLSYMIADAEMRCVIVRRRREEIAANVPQVALADLRGALEAHPGDNPGVAVSPDALAYMIYTSGSTGRPKGVMVEHRNALNFFVGMDHRIDATPGVWLAVTSISFDISVLELFWTLARGFTVMLHADGVPDDAPQGGAAASGPGLPFGLFYWNVATKERDHDTDKYRLLLESARFADTHGFNAVWTPERHFESFGGLFPNPSVTSAALATITSRVSLRAGSCVVPLHSPIRIAEEWAVVDNLSNGRVALSVAAGWATPDFAIRPESFDRAKQVMFESTDIVQQLWRGESVTFDGPRGPVAVRTLPRPIQKELPIWVTTAGNVQTFVEAGRRGANVLTHLLGQTFDDVAAKVRAYREARREAGHAGRGIVTIMLHTFIGPDAQVVEDTVKQPLKDYLRSATFLVKAAAWQFPTFKRMSEAQEQTLDEFFENISEEDMDGLLEFAFQRYFRTSGLFGTVERGLEIAGQVHAADIDEIACLIDFGIETDTVLAHLPYLDELRAAAQQLGAAIDDRFTLASLLAGGTVSHFQCTPSMARVVLAEPRARAALSGLRQMMVGGEALPPDIAADLAAVRPARVTNMYGPTETTIWSTVGDVTAPGPSAHVPIGRPLAHQTVYVLDDRGAPLPPGVTGELVIGGDGVTRGYWKQPELTAERFLADPFSGAPGARMYRTGDRGRFRPDGDIECLGRVDHQVKIRGHRVEPGEIESLLRSHEAVVEAVVIMREDSPGDQRLVAYLRGATTPPDADTMKAWLRGRLPEVMVPSAFVWLPALPLTPNGKVDRRALPAPAAPAVSAAASSAMPETAAEAMVAEIWQRALNIPSCGTRDNFFDLGGHSLLVVQVLTELRKKVSRPIQMTDLFKYTTIESLARFISAVDTPAAVSQASARASRRRMALERRSR